MAINYQVRINGGAPIDVGTALNYQATGLTLETGYTFQVRAYDASGNYSAWCTAVLGTTLGAAMAMWVDGGGNALVDGSGNALTILV